MKVWLDIFTEDEATSDSFPQLPVPDEEGNPVPGLFMIQSKIVAKGGEEIDVGGGNAFGGGGADEAVDDAVEKVNNMADQDVGFGYNCMAFDKKSEFKEYMKAYVVKVRKHLKQSGYEDMDGFKTDSQAAFKWLLANFKDTVFYVFKQFDTEAGGVWEYWDDEANTSGAPKFIFFKYGLKEVKY